MGLGALRRKRLSWTVKEEYEERVSRLEAAKHHLAELVGRIFSFMQDIGRAGSSERLRKAVNACSRFILPVLRRLAGGGGDGGGRGDDASPQHMDLSSDEALCWVMLEEISLLPRLQPGLDGLLSTTARENHVSRNWLIYSVATVSFLTTARFLYLHSSYNGSRDIQRWLHMGRENFNIFLRDHLFEPSRAIYKELFG